MILIESSKILIPAIYYRNSGLKGDAIIVGFWNKLFNNESMYKEINMINFAKPILLDFYLKK